MINPFTLSTPTRQATTLQADGFDWLRAIPYWLLHLAVLAGIWIAPSLTDLVVTVALFFLRVFALTGFYHRYFAHRAFKTNRVFQFLMGAIGATAAQRGPLWWAAHHRHHHRNSDQEEDIHSPTQKGFWYAHQGWIFDRKYLPTRYDAIKDFAKYPELRWLNRLHIVPFLLLLGGLYLVGGWSMLLWAGVIGTVALYHVTYFVNSLAHTWGTRRFPTRDTSRNNLLIALLTWGEGWHNNHHFYPGAARQGFYWWELDITYYTLWLLARVRLVRDLRRVPESVLAAGRRGIAIGESVRSGVGMQGGSEG